MIEAICTPFCFIRALQSYEKLSTFQNIFISCLLSPKTKRLFELLTVAKEKTFKTSKLKL